MPDHDSPPRPRATRILVEYSDGTADEATGPDADAILRGYTDAIAVAALHGCPYRGPTMRRVEGRPPIDPAACEHEGAIGLIPARARRSLVVCPGCGVRVMAYRSYGDYTEG